MTEPLDLAAVRALAQGAVDGHVNGPKALGRKMLALCDEVERLLAERDALVAGMVRIDPVWQTIQATSDAKDAELARLRAEHEAMATNWDALCKHRDRLIPVVAAAVALDEMIETRHPVNRSEREVALQRAVAAYVKEAP
jgi:hypothetical protein